jgi:hypothetical protein
MASGKGWSSKPLRAVEGRWPASSDERGVAVAADGVGPPPLPEPPAAALLSDRHPATTDAL